MEDMTLTDQNFNNEVGKEKLVMVDFWATWCPPCHLLGPILEEVAHEAEGRARVGKVNVDESPNTAALFKILSIPTVIVFKNGQLFDQAVGLREKAFYLEMIKKAEDAK